MVDAERQVAGGGRDLVDRGQLLGAALGEGDLRRVGHVAVDLRAGLRAAEPEPGARPALLLEAFLLGLRQPAEHLTVGGELDRARHRHVGADAGQRRQHGLLRRVEAGGEGVDRHHQAHPDRQAECGEDGAAAAPAELGEHVGQVEHEALLGFDGALKGTRSG